MRFILLVLALLSFDSTYAAPPVNYSIEPIIGCERTQKFEPTLHTHDRLTYGARLTAGFMILSAEAEYTRGSDSESFPAQGLVTSDTDDQLKIGLRTGYNLGPVFAIYGRGGVQARKNEHESIVSGVMTKT